MSLCDGFTTKHVTLGKSCLSQSRPTENVSETKHWEGEQTPPSLLLGFLGIMKNKKNMTNTDF